MPNPRLSGGYAHAFASLPSSSSQLADAAASPSRLCCVCPSPLTSFSAPLLYLPLQLVPLFNCHLRVISLRSSQSFLLLFVFYFVSFFFWVQWKARKYFRCPFAVVVVTLFCISCLQFLIVLFFCAFVAIRFLILKLVLRLSLSRPNPQLLLPNEFIKQEKSLKQFKLFIEKQRKAGGSREKNENRQNRFLLLFRFCADFCQICGLAFFAPFAIS